MLEERWGNILKNRTVLNIALNDKIKFALYRAQPMYTEC